MAQQIGEETKITLDLKTLGTIAVGIAAMVGMWFALQADIALAKELPEPVIDRIEYDLKDELIRQTILDTQEDVESMKEQLDKIEIEAISFIGGHRHHGNYNMSPGGETVSDNGKPIVAVYLPTMEETEYSSGREAARSLDIHMHIPADVANKLSKRDYHQDWYFYYANDKPVYPKLWGKDARGIKYRKARGKPVIVVPFAEPKEFKRFESVIEAANFIGCRQSDVSTVCAGKQISVHGYFCYFEDEPKGLPDRLGLEARSFSRSVPVWSLNLNRAKPKLIRHQSYSQAAQKTNVTQSSISAIISGKRKSENGFWFTDDPKRQPPEKGQWGKASVSHSKKIPVRATHISTGRIS